MKISACVLASVIVFGLPAPAGAAEVDTPIRSVLASQVEAWNRGDIDTFVKSYADDCTFVGKQVVNGKEKVLARYRSAYPNQAAMGKLAFTNLEVREIDTHSAFVIGRFHLERSAQGGGAASGIFTLVMKETHGEWRIVLDHTS